MENTSKSTLRLQLANALAALAALGLPAEELDLGEGEGEHLVEIANTLLKQQRLSDNAELEDYRLRESAIRKAVGDAEPGERTVLDSVRRLVTNLRNATRNPGSVVEPEQQRAEEARIASDNDRLEAENVRAALGRMLHFYTKPASPSWSHILGAVEDQRNALHAIAVRAGMPLGLGDMAKDPPRHISTVVGMRLDSLEADSRHPQPEPQRGPDIDPDDEAVVASDVVGIKRVSDDVISVKFKLVWSEDVSAITLGRAWMRFGVVFDQ